MTKERKGIDPFVFSSFHPLSFVRIILSLPIKYNAISDFHRSFQRDGNRTVFFKTELCRADALPRQFCPPNTALRELPQTVLRRALPFAGLPLPFYRK